MNIKLNLCKAKNNSGKTSSISNKLRIMTTTEVMHKVNLVDGKFTAMEAKEVINSLIDEKINFHKIHRLAMCEGDINTDTTFDDSRVGQLMREKEDFRAIYLEAKKAGKQVKISGILNIEIID